MPLLSREQVERMLYNSAAQCGACKAAVFRNYCRQCDDFCTDGHVDSCPAATHVGHKGYDSHAPMTGDDGAGHVYEHTHGAYRLNTNERY